MAHRFLLPTLAATGLLVLSLGASLPPDPSRLLSHMITAEGVLILPKTAQCSGWQLMLDPAQRPHLLAYCDGGRVVEAREVPPRWEAYVALPQLQVRARKRAVHRGNVYIEVRIDFLAERSAAQGMLLWEAASGRWRVLGEDDPIPRT